MFKAPTDLRFPIGWARIETNEKRLDITSRILGFVDGSLDVRERVVEVGRHAEFSLGEAEGALGGRRVGRDEKGDEPVLFHERKSFPRFERGDEAGGEFERLAVDGFHGRS